MECMGTQNEGWGSRSSLGAQQGMALKRAARDRKPATRLGDSDKAATSLPTWRLMGLSDHFQLNLTCRVPNWPCISYPNSRSGCKPSYEWLRSPTSLPSQPKNHLLLKGLVPKPLTSCVLSVRSLQKSRVSCLLGGHIEEIPRQPKKNRSL